MLPARKLRVYNRASVQERSRGRAMPRTHRNSSSGTQMAGATSSASNTRLLRAERSITVSQVEMAPVPTPSKPTITYPSPSRYLSPKRPKDSSLGSSRQSSIQMAASNIVFDFLTVKTQDTRHSRSRSSSMYSAQSKRSSFSNRDLDDTVFQ